MATFSGTGLPGLVCLSSTVLWHGVSALEVELMGSGPGWAYSEFYSSVISPQSYTVLQPWLAQQGAVRVRRSGSYLEEMHPGRPSRLLVPWTLHSITNTTDGELKTTKWILFPVSELRDPASCRPLVVAGVPWLSCARLLARGPPSPWGHVLFPLSVPVSRFPSLIRTPGCVRSGPPNDLT